jgi:hypothetical protein
MPMTIQKIFELPHAPDCLIRSRRDGATVFGLLKLSRNLQVIVESQQRVAQLLMLVGSQVAVIS